jgi:hypothetical protein
VSGAQGVWLWCRTRKCRQTICLASEAGGLYGGVRSSRGEDGRHGQCLFALSTAILSTIFTYLSVMHALVLARCRYRSALKCWSNCTLLPDGGRRGRLGKRERHCDLVRLLLLFRLISDCIAIEMQLSC